MAIVATKEMCYFCFDVLISHLEGKSVPDSPPNMENKPALIFVTWRQGHYEEGELRGCKGCTAQPKPLIEQLRRYSIVSGTQDTRFNPIESSEISQLSCHLSILHSFEEIKSCFDWVIGLHGVTIDFNVYDEDYTTNSKQRSQFEGHAIFLPNVAKANKWNQETTINQLIRKAGYKGKVDFSKVKIEAIRFQTASSHTDYKSYNNSKKRSLK